MRASAKKWLEDLGLAQYAEVFAKHAIELDVVFDLTDQDLKDLGVSLGDRKRLLRAIAAETTPRADKVERRQLTVMFCDLVDSTSLSTHYDPEELREIIGEFQDCCEAVVKQFGGYVARYMGDALLVYFGYPSASEHDPENAVRAGKGIVAAVSELAPRGNVRLRVRVGIATGAVVVGELIGHGAAQEQAVVGETPNLAKRLQEVAEPDGVVISEVTRRLVGGLFEYVDLGMHAMKGFDVPVLAWGVGAEAVATSRFEALRSQPRLSRLVGRDEEVKTLLDAWERAASGKGRAVILVGEAGIGKSRLAIYIRERLADSPHIPLSYGCVPHYQESALFPIINQIERTAGFGRDDRADVKLDKLESLLAKCTADVALAAPLYASLLSLPTGSRYPPLDITPRLLKEKTFELLQDQLATLAAKRPVLVIMEDLHWVDPTTLELIDRTLKRIQSLPVLVVLTARPTFQPPWPYAECATMPLTRLGSPEAASIVADVTSGRSLPAEIVDKILDKADGVPLFIEEMTRAMIESGQLQDRGDRFELTGTVPEMLVPSTLRDLLTSRIDRLGSAKDVAQIGAAIGRQFSYELLVAVTAVEESHLRDALDRLTDSKLLTCTGSPPNASYSFRHALLQDAAYATLLMSRRVELHRKIAEVLDARADVLNARPELLAWHYTKAGEHRKAIARWLEAAQHARNRAAHTEAIRHVKMALSLIQHLPEDSARGQLELDLHVALGINLEATGGYAAPEVAQNYAVARQLCEKLGDTAETVPVLLGLFVFHLVRADHLVAQELAEECMRVSEQSKRPDFLIDSCAALGHVLPHLGNLEESVPVLRRCISLSRKHRRKLSTPITAQDPEIASLCQLGIVLWMLGQPDQAAQQIGAAFKQSKKLAQPINLAMICPYAAELAQLRGETQKAIEYAGRGTSVASEHGYDYWHLLNVCHLGIAKATAGRTDEGLVLVSGGIEGLRGAGAQANLSYFLDASARIALRTGDVDKALELIGEAFEMAERTHEHFFLALLHDTRGNIRLALSTPDFARAESDFIRAIEVARSQRARSAELRAALSLKRLRLAQGRSDDGGALDCAYAAFGEGFTTTDLRAAGELLGKVAG